MALYKFIWLLTYTPTLLYIEHMLYDADEVLFHKVLKTARCQNNFVV